MNKFELGYEEERREVLQLATSYPNQ